MRWNVAITELNMDHAREALLRLHRGGQWNIRYWFGKPERTGTYGSVNIEEFGVGPAWQKYSKGEFCPEEYYNKIVQYMPQIISMDTRWSETVEAYDYWNTFNENVNFWYRLYKDNDIQLLVQGVMPHSEPSIVAALLARIMGIRVLILTNCPHMDGRFFINTCIETYGKPEFPYHGPKNHIDVKEEFHKNLSYMTDLTPVFVGGKESPIHSPPSVLNKGPAFIARRIREKGKYAFDNFLMTFAYMMIHRGLRRQFEYHKKHEPKPFNPSVKYVYFPLHLKPEMTTDVLGGMYYYDQLLAIERLSGLIPDDWIIYVKDNPKQTYFKRSKLFFDRLKHIEKARLVGYDVDTYDLISGSQFVATITGTAGWEAISGGKPAVVFGYTWYRDLPGVFEYSSSLRLEDIMNCRIDHEELVEKYNNLMNSLWPGDVESDYVCDQEGGYTAEEINDSIYNAISTALNAFESEK